MSSVTRKKESSARQVEDSEVSQYLLEESLLSDLKPSDFETFKTELGFRCRTESTYWEECKLGTIVDICCLGSTAYSFHQLGQTARTNKQVFDLFPALFISLPIVLGWYHTAMLLAGMV